MKRERKQQIKVETPDLEITLRQGDEELAVVALFGAGATEWDVLVGISDPALRNAVTLAFRTAAEAVESAAFRLIPTPDYERSDNTPPF